MSKVDSWRKKKSMASSSKRQYPFADYEDEDELKSNFDFTNYNLGESDSWRNVKPKVQVQVQAPAEQAKAKPQYYCSNDPFYPHCSTTISPTSKIIADIIAHGNARSDAREAQKAVRGLLRAFDDEKTCEEECTKMMQEQFTLPGVLQIAVRQFLPDDLRDLSGVEERIYGVGGSKEEELKEGKVLHPSLAKMFPRVATEFAGDEATILEAIRQHNTHFVYKMLAAHRGVGQINRILILLEGSIYAESVGKIIDLVIDRDYLNERLNETSKEIILRKFLIDVDGCSHYNPETCPAVAQKAEKLIRLGIILYPTVFLNPHNWYPPEPDSPPFQKMVDESLKLLWQQRKLPMPEPFKLSDSSKWADKTYGLFNKAISDVCESEFATATNNATSSDYLWNKFADYYSLDPVLRSTYPDEFNVLQPLKNLFSTLTPASTYSEQTAAFNECVELRKRLLAEKQLADEDAYL